MDSGRQDWGLVSNLYVAYTKKLWEGKNLWVKGPKIFLFV